MVTVAVDLQFELVADAAHDLGARHGQLPALGVDQIDGDLALALDREVEVDPIASDREKLSA